ncbi:MAG: hypothetical protein QXU81_07060 [Candidatus Bathyarchaeia archaeon]
MEKGLETEILEIRRIFERMEKQDEAVQIKPYPTSIVLDVGEKQIQVAINSDPERDHGVWVYNPSLYEKVYELGKTLGLQVKRGTSLNLLKVIQFNGVEGIKSVSGKMQNLIEGLIRIVKLSLNPAGTKPNKISQKPTSSIVRDALLVPLHIRHLTLKKRKTTICRLLEAYMGEIPSQSC